MSRTKIDPAVRRMVFDLAQHKRDPMKYQCAGCRHWFGMAALEIDHIIPEADSTPEQRSDPDNLQLLCNRKGSTRNTSCHKAKTAREAAARAKLNRARKDYRPAWLLTSASILLGGVCWQYIAQEDAQAAQDWATHSSLVMTGIAVGATAIQRFRYRRPRKAIPVAPLKPEEPGQEGLNTDRIVEGAREIMGARGVVVVDAASASDFSISYAGTGFADHESDKRWALQQKITAKIGDRWVVDWDTANDRARFTRRPPLPKKIHHPGLDESLPWHLLPVGTDATFDLLVTPHILIAGETMAGKTAMIRAMIAAASRAAARTSNVCMNLADPKKIEMMGFRGWPGVNEIITEPVDLWDFAFAQKQEMDRRYSLIGSGKAKATDFDRIINFWDEQEEFYNAVFNLWSSGLKDAEGEPFKRPGERTPGAIRAVASLLAMSRRCGIHNIIATQSPDALIFGKSGVRQNMPGRASVGSIDDIRARWLYGDSSVGRDIPSSAKGRATIQIGDGKPFEVQTFWVPDPADADPNYRNQVDDWATLLRLGMPTQQLPAEFDHLLKAE